MFGRILPALGLMLCLSTCYYAFLAYQLAKRTGRTDVCALPSGISVPHMFVVTFVVMLPILIRTHDPMEAWSAGLTWVFVQSFVLMVGGFIGPYVRKITPRAALLGSLAGISITFISMSPAAQVFSTPVIGVVCFAVILASWFGGVKYFGGVPGGLVAIAVGTIIAWVSNIFGLGYGGLTFAKMLGSVSNFGFSFPLPAFAHVFGGFKYFWIILVTAIPFGIYDLIEALDNVESAAAAGDSFPTTRVLTADGVISLIGCCLGNPFINAVYIGHPGWKAMGGRMGYSMVTGIIVLILTWFGIISVLMAVIPVVAILPILLYIGMLIGSQAFQESPHRHAPAIVLALLPQLAAWGKTQIDNALGAAGTSAAAIGDAKLAQVGVLYKGLETMGGEPRSPASSWVRSRCSSSTVNSKRPRHSPLPARSLRSLGSFMVRQSGSAVHPRWRCLISGSRSSCSRCRNTLSSIRIRPRSTRRWKRIDADVYLSRCAGEVEGAERTRVRGVTHGCSVRYAPHPRRLRVLTSAA